MMKLVEKNGKKVILVHHVDSVTGEILIYVEDEKGYFIEKMSLCIYVLLPKVASYLYDLTKEVIKNKKLKNEESIKQLKIFNEENNLDIIPYIKTFMYKIHHTINEPIEIINPF